MVWMSPPQLTLKFTLHYEVFKVKGVRPLRDGQARNWWLTPVILATQEAKIRRIMIQRQPRQIVGKTLSQKNLYKNKAGGVA
jgi:hypothetical protein